MTSRERVITALKHEEPDRVPLDLGGTESSSFTGIAYNNFRKYLKLDPSKTQIYDLYQQISKIDDDIREMFGVDTVPLLMEPRRWKQFPLTDGSSCEIPEKWDPVEKEGDLVVYDKEGNITARMPKQGYYFEPAYFPLAKVENPAQLDEYSEYFETYDRPFFLDESFNEIGARAKALYEDTEYAIVGNFMVHLLAAGQFLRGFDNFLVDLMVNKSLAYGILERLLDAYKKRAEEYTKQVGQYVQVILVNDDLGTQIAPMISLECYREMILPFQKKLFGFIKEHTDAFLLLHSCGSVYQFIPDLIEAGIDALNPVQVTAADMDSKKLKQEFGQYITFWGGGCDTQHVLNSGTPQQVREEVKRRVNDFSPGGGFVFTQVHNIQPDVPPENVVAMYEALSAL